MPGAFLGSFFARAKNEEVLADMLEGGHIGSLARLEVGIEVKNQNRQEKVFMVSSSPSAIMRQVRLVTLE